MIREKAICTVCDHKIVSGVACDGVSGECPTKVADTQQEPRLNSFAVTVDRVTGENEFDCVKGID